MAHQVVFPLLVLVLVKILVYPIFRPCISSLGLRLGLGIGLGVGLGLALCHCFESSTRLCYIFLFSDKQ